MLPPPHVPAPVPPKRSNGALQMLPLRPVSVAVSVYGMVGENLKIPPGWPAGAIFPRRTRGAVERKATSPFGGVQCSAPAASPSSTAARHPVEGLLHGWLKSTVRRRHERRTGGEVRQRPQRRRVGRDWNRKGNETGSTSGGQAAARAGHATRARATRVNVSSGVLCNRVTPRGEP